MRIAIIGQGLLAPKEISMHQDGDVSYYGASLPKEKEDEIRLLAQENSRYSSLDRCALMAILAGRRAVKDAGWEEDASIGINIGSSRGATGLIEHYHEAFLQKNTALSPLSSPTTTAGNISSWVAQDIGSKGIHFTHSITCSSALHAIANASAWLRSGMAKRFIAGGSEAPLTPFTIAQMRALRIYTSSAIRSFPCRPFTLEKNSMTLGEGAGLFALESEESSNSRALAFISGIGFASEAIEHPTSVSKNGEALYQAMKMAMRDAKRDVDLIITHAPGTLSGDRSELAAIDRLFASRPYLYSNKWRYGHTLGASGALSLAEGITIFKTQQAPIFPFETILKQSVPSKIQTILINSIGFGGNAVSLFLEQN
ncbi:MAG: beta-ketoacyl synthase [Bacteroidetes bacterium]|nr:beta-ketoacyl synthase [Bacteroidota bacterium]